MTLRRIACVEDEPDIRELTEMALRDFSGYDVRTFPSGPDALDGLAEFAPDLVVLDAMMPGMDGMTVLKEMRARPHLAGMPVVFMTAATSEANVREFMAAGALGVVAKPYDPMTLGMQLAAFVPSG
ncbi:response regulator [Jannaschia seohaensis]|uniref:Response regulator receiver domain-containing protein n=1 Tax=Jannaschia seohaensis TaxID=475081 RepID=A0A2Y9A211_9RHOB|nr:response regulator [Jannaschia seohaensis]PWJ22156.1 response regulator receiver domain-containing protein [Jannaschia seohaensis]SSA38434.1 Response regulator receiver domain-containing protein [Jannaschia seohaensis]